MEDVESVGVLVVEEICKERSVWVGERLNGNGTCVEIGIFLL